MPHNMSGQSLPDARQVNIGLFMTMFIVSSNDLLRRGGLETHNDGQQDGTNGHGRGTVRERWQQVTIGMQEQSENARMVRHNSIRRAKAGAQKIVKQTKTRP